MKGFDLPACGLAAAWLLAACAPPPKIDLIKEASFAPADSEAAWARWHWYAADQRQGFSTSEYFENGYRGLRTFVDYSLVAKVLTTDGSQVGTLPLPGFRNSEFRMEAELYDSAGVKKPLDRKRLDSIFREKEALIIPNVTPGCVIVVRISQGPFGYIRYWQFPLSLSVPVAMLRVSASYPKRMRYLWNSPPGLAAPVDSIKAGKRHVSWTRRNVLPDPDLPFDDGLARPRLMLVNAYNPQGGGLPHWGAVAGYVRAERFAHSVLDLGFNAKSKAKALTRDAVDDRDKARRILAWVQDNITWEDGFRSSQDPDEVLAMQRASRWHMASLFKVMCAGVDVKSEIVVGRSRDLGGLDPAMPDPAAAFDPIVIVDTRDGEFAACPHYRWLPLGRLPHGMAGQSALNPRTGQVGPLPQDTAVHVIETELTLSPVSPGKRSLKVRLEGPAADEGRMALDNGLNADACGRLMGSYGYKLKVKSCKAEGLEDRDAPLRLEIEGEGDALARIGAVAVSRADNALSRPAWFYDSARVEDYWFPYAMRRKETVLLNSSGAAAALACATADQPGFGVACVAANTAEGRKVTRVTVFKQGLAKAADLSAAHKEMATLAAGTPAFLPSP